MKRSFKLGLVLVSAWLFATGAAAQEAAPGGDLEAGRYLAFSVCSECHVVAADQPSPPDRKPPAPSFAEIANQRGVSSASLHHFLLSTHRSFDAPPDMPRMWFTQKEADDVVTYILSLRTRR